MSQGRRTGGSVTPGMGLRVYLFKVEFQSTPGIG